MGQDLAVYLAACGVRQLDLDRPARRRLLLFIGRLPHLTFALTYAIHELRGVQPQVRRAVVHACTSSEDPNSLTPPRPVCERSNTNLPTKPTGRKQRATQLLQSLTVEVGNYLHAPLRLKIPKLAAGISLIHTTRTYTQYRPLATERAGKNVEATGEKAKALILKSAALPPSQTERDRSVAGVGAGSSLHCRSVLRRARQESCTGGQRDLSPTGGLVTVLGFRADRTGGRSPTGKLTLHEVITFQNSGLQRTEFPVALSFHTAFEDVYTMRELPVRTIHCDSTRPRSLANPIPTAAAGPVLRSLLGFGIAMPLAAPESPTQPDRSNQCGDEDHQDHGREQAR
jgi:hypothetical protein